MNSRTAVVIDHDHETGERTVEVLRRIGFQVHVARTGREGVTLVEQTSPDLVTTEIDLADVDGIEVCRQVRALSRSYLMVISAQDTELDRLMSLEVGADDFLAKPHSARELQARVAALFRRPRGFVASPALTGASAPSDQTSELATPRRTGTHTVTIPAARRSPEDSPTGLEVDPHARQVRVDGELIDLTRTEFDLLAHLTRQPGVVVRREELIREVWDTTHVPESTHLVDVHLANVRRKLRNRGGSDWIRTVRGVGLRFDPC